MTVPVTVGVSDVIAVPCVAVTGLVYDNALGAGTELLLLSLPPQPARTNSDAPLNSSATKYLDIFTDNLLYVDAIAPKAGKRILFFHTVRATAQQRGSLFVNSSVLSMNGRVGDAINKLGKEEGLERYCSRPDLPMTYVGCAMTFTLAVRSRSQSLCGVVHTGCAISLTPACRLIGLVRSTDYCAAGFKTFWLGIAMPRHSAV